MKIQNIRIETFDNGQGSKPYMMIMCDVVKFELRKKIVIKDVAEYINFNGVNYEVESIDSNLESHEERLNKEEIIHVQTVFFNLVKTQKTIEELEHSIENCQKNYDIKRKILMYAECYRLKCLGLEKDQNCDRLIETLDYLESDIDSFINEHTEHYLPLNFIQKPNENELENYRAETYQDYVDNGYIEDDEDEEEEIYFW